MQSINLLIFLLLLTGCSSPLCSRDSYMVAYHASDFHAVDEHLSHTIARAMPAGDYRESRDAVWLLLDRATTRFAQGETEGAVADYHQAIESIDFYNQKCVEETIGKLVLQDEWGAYAGEDYEQILAHIYFALALMHEGDTNNSFAMLRQAEELQQKKQLLYKKNRVTKEYTLVDNPVGKFLFASLLEKRGDSSNANILKTETKELVGKRNYEAACNIDSDPATATLILLCHQGQVRYKVSGLSEATMASALALEILLGSQGVTPALSTLPGIPTPFLIDWPLPYPRPVDVAINGQEQQLIPWMDINAIAEEQLDQQMPLIIARGAARLLLRRGMVEALHRQDAGLGTMTDLALLFANLNTKADTRSWTTLPARIDLARIDLPAGLQSVVINGRSYSLCLSKGALCIINIFNLRPGFTRVQIPKEYHHAP